MVNQYVYMHTAKMCEQRIHGWILYSIEQVHMTCLLGVWGGSTPGEEMRREVACTDHKPMGHLYTNIDNIYPNCVTIDGHW